jgi:hypothetical protein
MTINGDGVPKTCAKCPDSYWEEMMYGEDAYCGKYNKLCTDALKQCDEICCFKCSECPRHG